MESNEYKGTKVDFSYFVRMALQNNMAWNTLAMILKDLAPTLNETREIICILLKELEGLQVALKKKDKELEKNLNVGSPEDSGDDVQENEHQISVKETETMDDEIKVIEVVKESINQEMNLHFDTSENQKPFKKYVNKNDEHDSGEIAAEESLGEIDNEWYTFVKNTNTSEPDTELLKEKESENNTESSNSTEYVNHVTIDELDSSNKNAVNLVMKMDHEWNTLDKHD